VWWRSQYLQEVAGGATFEMEFYSVLNFRVPSLSSKAPNFNFVGKTNVQFSSNE
jgi:hypothetical protein